MMACDRRNPMLPYLAQVAEVKELADEIKLFSVELVDGDQQAFRHYEPGQFAFLSVFGVGEAPFGMASKQQENPILEFAIQRLGAVTTGLHRIGEGDMVGVRGPMGKPFPMQDFEGKNLLVLGGGIGGAPLRPVIQTVLEQREAYGRLTILWAARRPSLLIFQDEYDMWSSSPDIRLHVTVDEAEGNWEGNVGLITDLLEKVDPSPEATIAITCGPPVMIHFVGKMLAAMGFEPENCYTTLEARMHCGIGKCGRCNLGDKLICVDGPVFNMAEIGELLENFL